MHTHNGRWSRSLAVGFAVLAAFVVAPIASISAHSNHDHKIYVAPFGKDEGDCSKIWQPCATIDYAISRGTGKGDEIRVAAGDYSYDAKAVGLLLSRQIPVRGGFSARDNFMQQDPKANPTYIAGIPSRYRERLAAIGFARVEDRDGRNTPELERMQIPTELETPSAAQPCTNGMAGIFECNGIDFLGSVPLSSFVVNGNGATDGSNLWGHVDLNTDREYAIIGVNNGTGVVDVTDPANPVVIGTVPGNNSQWREVKVYQYFNQAQNRWNAYAYLSTESRTQGLQIVDLNHLSDPTPSVSLAATYTADFGSSHTVYIKNVDLSTNVALPGKTAALYMNGVGKNGSRLNSGVFRAFDISNPLTPQIIDSGVPDTNISYTHDDTSMIITDSRTSACAPGHQASCEIMFDFSESSVEIWDITDSAAPFHISSRPYSGSGYTHSGWYSDDKMYVFIQDELDEQNFGHNTRVRTMDIHDLDNPTISATWDGPTRAIDHNGYTIGNKYYMSNYLRGLTILDITNPNSIQEAAFFDTYPGSNSASFDGAWGVYPYLPSGTLMISDISRGLILVREPTSTPDQAIAGLEATNDGPTVAGAATNFEATIQAGTNVTYAWDFGDGTAVMTSTNTTISHTYPNAGNYTVELTASNGTNSQTDTTSVVVQAPPQTEWKIWLPFAIRAE